MPSADEKGAFSKFKERRLKKSEYLSVALGCFNVKSALSNSL